jgi:hypothetical protein
VAKYLVKEKSLVNSSIVEAGTVVEYDPPEGVTTSSNLELVTEEPSEKKGKGKRAKDEDAGSAEA